MQFSGLDVTEELIAMAAEDSPMLSKIFKVIGQIEEEDGAGVVGHNTATEGDAVGVEGATESDEGYGLYTQDDARVEGDLEVDESISTDGAGIGGATGLNPSADNRPIISNEDRTISVGDDVETIQDAVNQVPIYLRHNWVIDIPDGTYEEDVFVPPILNERGDEGGNVGEVARQNLQLVGNRSDPSSVKIDSLYISGVGNAAGVQAFGIEFQSDNPYDDEDFVIAVYGGNGFASIADCAIAGGTHGIISYNATLSINDVDFGVDVLPGFGVKIKYDGFAYVKEAHGNVGARAYETGGPGWIKFNGDNSTLTGDDGLVRESAGASRKGTVADYSTSEMWGIRELPEQQVSRATGHFNVRITAGDQNIAANEIEKVEFEGPDPWNNNNHELVVPNDSILSISGSIRFDVGTEGDRLETFVVKNNDVQFARRMTSAPENRREVVPFQTVITKFDEGDVIDFRVRNADSADTIENTNFNYCYITEVQRL